MASASLARVSAVVPAPVKTAIKETLGVHPASYASQANFTPAAPVVEAPTLERQAVKLAGAVSELTQPLLPPSVATTAPTSPTVFAKRFGHKKKVVMCCDFGDSVDSSLALIHMLRSPDLDVVGVVTTGINGELNADIVRNILKFFGKDRIPVAVGNLYPKGQESLLKEYQKEHVVSEGLSYEASEIIDSYPGSKKFLEEMIGRYEGELFIANFAPMTDLADLDKNVLRKAAGIYQVGQAHVVKGANGEEILYPNMTAAHMRADPGSAAAVLSLQNEVPMFFFGKHLPRHMTLTREDFQSMLITENPLATHLYHHAFNSLQQFMDRSPQVYKEAYGLDELPKELTPDTVEKWSNPYHLGLALMMEDPEKYGATQVGQHLMVGTNSQELGALDPQILKAELVANLKTIFKDSQHNALSTVHSPSEIVFPEVAEHQTPTLVITDMFRDPDDLQAYIYMMGHPDIEIVGVVAEHMIPYRRAKGILELNKSFDRPDIPIAEGYSFPMGYQDAKENHLDGRRATDGRILIADGLAPIFHNPVNLIKEAIRKYEGKLNIIVLAPMRSLAEAVLQDPELAQKIGKIIIMGQVKSEETKEGRTVLSPSKDAYNLSIDQAAADVVFNLQGQVPFMFLGKHAAKAVPFDQGLAEDLAYTRHLAGLAMFSNAVSGLISFAHRDPRLFRTVFGLKADAPIDDQVIRAIKLNPYDLLAALLLRPENLSLFDPVVVGAHTLIGNTADQKGVSHPEAILAHAREMMFKALRK